MADTPGIPKGYEKGEATFKLIQETYFYKKPKPIKSVRPSKVKEYVQKVELSDKSVRELGQKMGPKRRR